MPLHFLVSDQDQTTIGASELDQIAVVYGKYLAPKKVLAELQCLDLQEMQALNLQTRSIDEPTDVLSFPTFESKEAILHHPETEEILLGTIALCPEKAVLYTETLPQLVHHGLLHLCGFDHETNLDQWKREEQMILDQLAVAGLSIPGIPL